MLISFCVFLIVLDLAFLLLFTVKLSQQYVPPSRNACSPLLRKVFPKKFPTCPTCCEEDSLLSRRVFPLVVKSAPSYREECSLLLWRVLPLIAKSVPSLLSRRVFPLVVKSDPSCREECSLLSRRVFPLVAKSVPSCCEGCLLPIVAKSVPSRCEEWSLLSRRVFPVVAKSVPSRCEEWSLLSRRVFPLVMKSDPSCREECSLSMQSAPSKLNGYTDSFLEKKNYEASVLNHVCTFQRTFVDKRNSGMREGKGFPSNTQRIGLHAWYKVTPWGNCLHYMHLAPVVVPQRGGEVFCFFGTKEQERDLSYDICTIIHMYMIMISLSPTRLYLCMAGKHKVRTYKEYHSVYPSSELGLPPTPHPQASVPPPPCFWGEGNTRWRERGWESPNSDEGRVVT